MSVGSRRTSAASAGGPTRTAPTDFVGTKQGDLILAGAGDDVVHAGDGFSGPGRDVAAAGKGSFPNTFVRECVRTGDGPLTPQS